MWIDIEEVNDPAEVSITDATLTGYKDAARKAWRLTAANTYENKKKGGKAGVNYGNTHRLGVYLLNGWRLPDEPLPSLRDTGAATWGSPTGPP